VRLERLVPTVSMFGLLAIAAMCALMLAHVVGPLLTVVFNGGVAAVVILANTVVATWID
jgi:hypothetical protein